MYTRPAIGPWEDRSAYENPDVIVIVPGGRGLHARLGVRRSYPECGGV